MLNYLIPVFIVILQLLREIVLSCYVYSVITESHTISQTPDRIIFKREITMLIFRNGTSCFINNVSVFILYYYMLFWIYITLYSM